MNSHEQWAGADHPITIHSTLAQKLEIPPHIAKTLKPGAFRFNDGTTQGWQIDQFYDTNAKTLLKIPPFVHPSTNEFFGFVLKNSQNLALAAFASPAVALAGPGVTSIDFYLQSPDLAANPDWKAIQGYSLDLQRNYISPTFNNGFLIQLQFGAWDKEQQKDVIYGEKDPKTGSSLFHPIQGSTPYHFSWTPKDLAKPELELRFLRIRFTQPYPQFPGAGETLPKGAWLIGNIAPES